MTTVNNKRKSLGAFPEPEATAGVLVFYHNCPSAVKPNLGVTGFLAQYVIKIHR